MAWPMHIQERHKLVDESRSMYRAGLGGDNWPREFTGVVEGRWRQRSSRGGSTGDREGYQKERREPLNGQHPRARFDTVGARW